MHDYIIHAFTVFTGFFAIMNPIANTAIFLGLTEDDDAAIRKAVARRALLFAYLIILIFTVSGHMIFKIFGIGLPAFKITGGLMGSMILRARGVMGSFCDSSKLSLTMSIIRSAGKIVDVFMGKIGFLLLT